MDVTEDERDVQLQRTSSDLLADLETSLSPFLGRTGKAGNVKLRRRVYVREVERLIALLEPFQELPQLLDPHLENLIPKLAKALISSLRLHPTVPSVRSSKSLLPLPTAISKLLYVFCKVRGEKVIVRFFGTDTKYLEILLVAQEYAETTGIERDVALNQQSTSWSWEQRYICLLWISHLLLLPFDLATIISHDNAEAASAEIPGLIWPPDMPAIPLKVVPLAIRYVSSSGKERESATAVLVRIALRKDMQELGLLQALVEWALSSLQSISPTTNSIYFHIGILSFLASLLVSSMDTSDMDFHLLKIFRKVESISNGDSAAFRAIQSSAVARKNIIKALRSAAVLVLRDQSLAAELETTEVVEMTISHLLEALGDNETPVRLAASKSLSVITLRLAPSMAAQVVDALLVLLNRNVLLRDGSSKGGTLQSGDLSAVNPLEWHGLVMTLSHLLYRRSPPPTTLPDIVRCLVIGLTFEQKSTTGGSIGANVRDAACFGFWALARQYSTLELQNVQIETASFPSQVIQVPSTIQILATELIAAACLDPVGNIRRAASAALQELIGRHPDVVAEGIAIVQIVDYHAVAVRSRAVLEVSPKAAEISRLYEGALVNAVLGWRGVGDPDPASRRTASIGIGKIARNFQALGDCKPWNMASSLVLRIEQQSHAIKVRDIDQRHGILLLMAAVMSAMAENLSAGIILSEVSSIPNMLTSTNLVLQAFSSMLQDAQLPSSRRPELIAEAGSRLIVAACLLIRRAHVLSNPDKYSRTSSDHLRSPLKGFHVLLKNPKFIFEMKAADVEDLVSVLDLADISASPTLSNLIETSKDLLDFWLLRTETETVDATMEAAASMILVIGCTSRNDLIGRWLKKALTGQTFGHLYAVVAIFPVASKDQKENITHAILDRWKSSGTIESRMELLQCIARSTFLASHASLFVEMMNDGLDDYTTDSRGDVGSLVRVEALKAMGNLFGSIHSMRFADGPESHVAQPVFTNPEQIGIFYGKVLRLAAEKLDRVRMEAQRCLTILLSNSQERKRFSDSPISSYDYFQCLFEFQMRSWDGLSIVQHQHGERFTEFLAGFVTSADSGSESLVKACRAALVDFCDGSGLVGLTKTERCDLLCVALSQVMKKHIANDRVLVSTMEVMGFLFDAGIMQRSGTQWRRLCLLVQKAHYKTTNVRKLEAAVKLYGHMTELCHDALLKLTSMLLHPFPVVRSRAADTLFVAKGVGLGVNWVRAQKIDLARLQDSISAHT